MTLPNFFVIGAQKAGTTSLYHYLTQHPEIFMSPVKEPSFFNCPLNPRGEVVWKGFGNPNQSGPRFGSIEEYRALYDGVGPERAIGEASPAYLYVRGTAERIKAYAPEARLVALLRQPADRAYSAYLHAVRIGREPLADFAQALREERGRIERNWHYTFHYRSRGFYHAQLERYYEAFGSERVGVWLYDDLRADPVRMAQEIFGFLGVDESFVPDVALQHNVSGLPRGRVARAVTKGMDKTASAFLRTFSSASRAYPLASRVRHRIQGRLLAKPPPLDPALRDDLTEGYRNDISKLEALIGRDLSAWLTAERTGRGVGAGSGGPG